MTDTTDKLIIQSETQGVQQSTDQLNKLKGSMDGVSVSAQNVEKSTGSVDSKFAALERRLGTVAGQSAKFEAAQRTINAALAANPGLQARANEALAAAEARFIRTGGAVNEVAKSAQLTRSDLINLGRQGSDVFVSLAGGINPLMVGLQQLPQALDPVIARGVPLKAAFSQVASGAVALITPLTATIAGVTALSFAAGAAALQMDRLQVSSQRALSGAGQRTGTTVSDLNAFTSQNASRLSGAGLSTKEARDFGEDLTRTGEIVISRLRGMSDAVVGFSNQTGKSMDEARKAMVGFAVDPKKAIEELAQTYGSFDVATRKAVDALVLADDKTGAFQVIIDALSEKSKAAAQNMGFFEKAGRSVINLLSTEVGKPAGLEEQLAATQAKLAQEGNGAARSSGSTARLRQEVLDLQAAIEKVNAGKAAAEINKLSTAADGAARSINPQIDQIEQLRTKLEQLERAKAAGTTSKYGAQVDNDAITAYQNIIAATQQAQAEAARYNELVKEISTAWGNVGQATALSLQGLQNQLGVANAVGGAEKMMAQEAADYANAVMQGKTALEASQIAAMNLALAQAQVNSAARETLFNLQNMAQVAAAVTGQQQMQAQAQAQYNQLVHDGVDAILAEKIAAQQLANSQAQATANVEKQIEALKDSTAMIKAQQNGTEASTAAAIAYKNAIASGADETAAAALKAATLANYMAQAASSGQSLAAAQQAFVNSFSGVYVGGVGGSPYGGVSTGEYEANTGGGWNLHDPIPSGQYGSALSPVGELLQWDYNMQQQAAKQAQSFAAMVNQAGDINAALTYAMGQQAHGTQYGVPGVIDQFGRSTWEDWGMSAPVLGQAVSESEIISQVSQLYDLKNQMTADKSTQLSNLNAEMAWLQSRPQSIDQMRAIAQLRQSIEQLTNSTDSLNSTNQELLSPYYTQDPRKSHIGFRSQGMATGGYVDVPGGISANDNMLAMIPVASGERIYVDPMSSKRGVGQPSQTTININVPITIVGNANKDEVGRTVYQSMQTAARQLAAAQR